MALKPVTVSQLNEYISRVIGTDPLLGAVVVRGEASGVKYHSSGHVYFSIADAASRISCFLPREYAASLGWQLEDGMEVVITGSVSIYKKNGTYSLYVRNMELSGAGSLAVAFEQMKQKLQKEGLFDPAHKKAIPRYPRRVGVITSRTGAAVRDILKIIRSRNNVTDVIVFPVLVQGDGAAADIAAMIDFVNTGYDDIDTLIVGRGGGSAEDLWAFNEEAVARSIYASRIPVISAVGHEIDFTISDLVADARAETPTAAAQMAVPDTEQLADMLRQMRQQLYTQLSNKLMYHRLLIDGQAKTLLNSLKERTERLYRDIGEYRLILEENNPLKILENGYSVVYDRSGLVISGIGQLEEGESYHLRMKDGTAVVTVAEKKEMR